MSCGRFAFSIVLMFALGVPFLLPAPVARADGFCGPDTILVRASADTIYVRHENALKNCCLELHVRLDLQDAVVDFYEEDVGDPCHCICCFDLNYLADGFAAGHYTVRIWNEDGSILFGQAEVEVVGDGSAPHLISAAAGECQDPQPIQRTSWGVIRTIFRFSLIPNRRVS